MKNLVLLFSSLCLAGCSGGPTDFTKEYHEALSSRSGLSMTPQSARTAVGGFAKLYGDLSVSNVTANVRNVYAPGAWFNDTIATEVGIDAIEKYLLKTAEGAETVSAKINDIAVSGSDCYVRWTMEIRTKNLAGGKPIITEGISQLLFDGDGRILLHQDFWNPATGIYQHLPLLGPAIRFVNGLISGSHN